MALSNWFNRYILEVKPEKGAEPAKADDPPEVRAKSVELVPTKPAREVITKLPEPDLAALEKEFMGGGAAAETPPPLPPEAQEPPPLPPEATKPPPLPPEAQAPQKDPMDDGKDPPVSVAQVYAAAKIGPPSHGFTLEKIAGMLSDERMAALPEAARANAIAVVLETQGIKLTNVVQDAAERDAALDRFEGFLTDKLISMEVEVDEKHKEIEEEIRRYTERKREEQKLARERLTKKERELARFRRVKRAEEQRLFDVVRHFTAENPVSVTALGAGPSPAPAPGPAPAADGEGEDVSYKDIAAQLRQEREE